MRPAHRTRHVALAVGPIGVGRLPVVVAEMRLGERDQHASVIGGAQHFGVLEVRARLAAVVVGVNHIDAEGLESLEGLASGIVSGLGSAYRALSSGTAERKILRRSRRNRGHQSRTRGTRTARGLGYQAPGSRSQEARGSRNRRLPACSSPTTGRVPLDSNENWPFSAMLPSKFRASMLDHAATALANAGAQRVGCAGGELAQIGTE